MRGAAVDLQIFKAAPANLHCDGRGAEPAGLECQQINSVSVGSARFDSQLSNWLCASALGRDVGPLRLLSRPPRLPDGLLPYLIFTSVCSSLSLTETPPPLHPMLLLLYRLASPATPTTLCDCVNTTAA